MNLRVHLSSKLGYDTPKEEAVLAAGQAAAICYMPSDFDAILDEDQNKTTSRAAGCKTSKHYSTYAHVRKTLCFEGIPKLAAMVLNNERPANISEKSGRYTIMFCAGRELELYNKWLEIFAKLIAAEYPHLKPDVVQKLSQENARCFISVLTPTTTMDYSVDMTQANFIIHWLNNFCDTPTSHPLKEAIKPALREIASGMYEYCGIEGIEDYRGRTLPSFFANRSHAQEFGETFSINRKVSFASGAHFHRSQSLIFDFEVESDPSKAEFYIPRILEGSAYFDEYLADMRSIADLYPAGMLINMNMRGTPENLILLLQERLCGAVLPETCFTAKSILEEYCQETVQTNPAVYEMLNRFSNGTKCSFGHYTCTRPCPLGPAMCFTRKA